MPPRNSGRGDAGHRHNLSRALIFLNFLLYLVVIGLASWIIDNPASVIGNVVSDTFVFFALLAGVVGTASFFAALPVLRRWATATVAAAAAAGFVAFSLTILALGFASKEINDGGFRTIELRVLEGFVIAVSITQLLYVVLLTEHMFN